MKRIILCDTNEHVVTGWRQMMAPVMTKIAGAVLEHIQLEIVQGDILEQKCDAVVSPANSFGFMDGGIDAHYTDVFGPQLQRQVQDTIKGNYEAGELLIGQAFVAITHHKKIPYCVIAPTMRIPMDIQGTVNAYLATRAAVKRLIGSGVVETLSIPGMGTGCGRLSPKVAALQMFAGILHAFEQPRFPESWYEESKNHTFLSVGKVT